MPRGYARSDRPTGVELVAGYGVLNGLVGAALGVAVVVGGVEAVLPAVFGVVSVVVSLAQVYVSLGLWRMQRWAYEWAVVLYGATGLFSLGTAVLGDPVLGIAGAVVSGLVVAYLLSERRRFRRARY